ncbi:MAG: type II 3-dehydroquinate dehydratase [Bacteroidia bacterium]|nr:type II 3-dehydroquinate dehydratase [Bacteroidia bacterium]
MKRIRILHGPNVAQIGSGREPMWYGSQPWSDFWGYLRNTYAHQAELTYLESSYEGQLVDWIWETDQYDALILNPGALAHTSYALYDALLGCGKPCIEVHYSPIHQRERFRQRLITAQACRGVISGLGWLGYELALIALLRD